MDDVHGNHWSADAGWLNERARHRGIAPRLTLEDGPPAQEADAERAVFRVQHAVRKVAREQLVLGDGRSCSLVELLQPDDLGAAVGGGSRGKVVYPDVVRCDIPRDDSPLDAGSG